MQNFDLHHHSNFAKLIKKVNMLVNGWMIDTGSNENPFHLVFWTKLNKKKINTNIQLYLHKYSVLWRILCTATQYAFFNF